MDIIHLTVTAGLVVLIWVIQTVHYPSFAYYQEQNFKQAMSFHQRSISLIVIPLMLIEILVVTFFALFYRNHESYVFLFLVSLIWGSTFLLQVPLHQKLLVGGKDLNTISKLVKTNWLRTTLWTMKFIYMIFNFAQSQ